MIRGKNIAICAAVLAVFCVTPQGVRAQQEKHSASVHYGITFPSGDGFIDGTGFLDLSAEYGLRLTSTLSAGVSAGYGYDHRSGHTTDRYDGDLVNGFSDRNLTVVPIHLWFRFFPWGQQARWQPYVTIGAGMQYARFEIRGDQIDSREASGFGMSFSPQIGSRFFPRTDKKIYLDARISWRHSENEWKVMNVGSVRRICVALGTGVVF